MKLTTAIRTIALLTLGLWSAHSVGVEVGAVTVLSKLGEPLRASMVLTVEPDIGPDQLIIKQASRQQQQQLGVSSASRAPQLDFSLSNNGAVLITTRTPVKEPFLHFVVQVQWPEGELYREFTLLIDPSK